MCTSFRGNGRNWYGSAIYYSMSMRLILEIGFSFIQWTKRWTECDLNHLGLNKHSVPIASFKRIFVLHRD